MTSTLRPVPFGLTTAIVWSACVFFLGVTAACFDWGNLMQSAIRSIYPGYRRTPAGIVIGAIWAFIDGFFGGTVFALIYNWIGGSGNSNGPKTVRKK